MNARQRKIIIIATAFVFIMIMFPPTIYWSGKTAYIADYEFLFSIGRNESIRFDVLLLQVISVIVPAAVSVWMSKDCEKTV